MIGNCFAIPSVLNKGVIFLAFLFLTILSFSKTMYAYPDPNISSHFLELDSRASRSGVEGIHFFYANHRSYVYRYPHAETRTNAHLEYAQNFVNNVSLAIRYGTFEEISELIDINSFVDFYIIQELFKNANIHSFGVSMFIDGIGENRRLFKDLIWDFDTVARNILRNIEIQLHDPESEPENLYVAVQNYWYRNLFKWPEFVDAVAIRWTQIRNNEITEVLNHINQTLLDYQDDFHISWLEARISWLDTVFMHWIHFGELNHDPIMELINYHRRENTNRLSINGRFFTTAMPIITITNRNFIELADAVRVFGLNIQEFQNTILITKGNESIFHEIGSSFFVINGRPFSFDMPTITTGDFIYFPIRIIAYALDYEVGWNLRERIIDLS